MKRNLKNKQTIFNTVVRHLFKQGERSFRPATDVEQMNGWKATTSFCLYRAPATDRNPDGLSCAIGCLMLDTEYNTLYEKKAAHAIPWSKPNPLSAAISREGHPFFTTLQVIHDDQESWDVKGVTEKGKRALATVAKDYGLNARVLNRCWKEQEKNAA